MVSNHLLQVCVVIIQYCYLLLGFVTITLWSPDLKGIPEFWITALKNVDLFEDYIMVSVCGLVYCNLGMSIMKYL